MKTAKLIVGDWSDDGHGKTQTYFVEYPSELKHSPEEYYQLALAKGAPDFTEAFEGYASYHLSWDLYTKLDSWFKTNDVSFPWDETVGAEEDDMYMECDTYVDLWVVIANTGIGLAGESGTIRLVAETKFQTFCIGGYGLFE